MRERLAELKNKATERANYYTKINFPNLANEFTELANILNEMENIIKERDELKAQVQVLEEKARESVLQARAARDGEECVD